MRNHFKEKASSLGIEMLNMEPVFISHFREYGRQFEFTIDSHWNEPGYCVVADALSNKKDIPKF